MSGCIAFTGGGTGGHVFPALAVLENLPRKGRDRVIWIGSKGGIERKILEKKRIPYYGIPSGKLRRYLSFKNFFDLFKIAGGIIASFLILRKEKPGLLFSKGGYVSVPPVIAASLLRIPVFTHESDLRPGLATRINYRFAEKVLVSFPGTENFFAPDSVAKLIYTGNPIRSELLTGDPGKGRSLVGCPKDLPMLLVLGGSQGSAFINELIILEIENLSRACFVVHQMGIANYTASIKANYYAAPFFTGELPHLLAAADLVVCRSGANTLWEVAALGKSALLIPLSQAASRGDQIENAEYFTERGAALVLPEEEATGPRLLEIVVNLLDNRERLEEMGKRAFSLSIPDSALRIADLLVERIRRENGGD